MSISVLARVQPTRDVLVTDEKGRVLYWGNYQSAYAAAPKTAENYVVYEAANKWHMAERLGVSVDDLVRGPSSIN